MSAIPHILLVDDDQELRELVSRYLSNNDFQVSCADAAPAMDAILAKGWPDLMILDLMLPGEDGLSIAKRLKAQQPLPIIMLSAKGEDIDRIVGLEVGADDYLAKPFNPRELLARVRAVLRRPQQSKGESQAQRYKFGEFVLDTQRHQLTRNGELVHLTTSEYELLEILVQHPNQVLDRDTLVTQLKGYDRSPFDRSIDVRVTRLRAKLEKASGSLHHIQTIWGKGYLFVPDPEG
ncbi:response regulator [Balneatrix alpica]|uniref:Response regulator n=1 Tax=Balneatrix alpica TaxID=75684 RepID=A0ABV5ZEW8_9GAMM|nr:response regulator [Balneatrix alpica]